MQPRNHAYNAPKAPWVMTMNTLRATLPKEFVGTLLKVTTTLRRSVLVPNQIRCNLQAEPCLGKGACNGLRQKVSLFLCSRS